MKARKFIISSYVIYYFLGGSLFAANTATVSNNGGGTGTGTLYKAIQDINSGSGAGVITIDSSLLGETINLEQALPALNKAVTINGPALTSSKRTPVKIIANGASVNILTLAADSTLKNVNIGTSNVSGSGGSIDLDTHKLTLQSTGTSSPQYFIYSAISGTGGELEGSGGQYYIGNSSNSYTGGTTITGGLLGSQISNSFGSGTITISDGQVVFDSSGTYTVSNDITLNEENTFLQINNGRASFTGTISDGSNTYNLTKDGSGTLVMSQSSANSYGGTTQVGTGTLEFSADNQLGSGKLSVVGGTQLALNDNVSMSRDFELGGLRENQAVRVIVRDHTFTISGETTGASTNNVWVNDGSSSSTASGTLYLSNASNSSLNSPIFIYQGATLKGATGGSLGTGQITLASANSTLEVASNSSNTVANDIVLSGDDCKILLSGSGQATFSGTISGSKPLNLQGASASMKLSSANTYTGGTVIGSDGTSGIVGGTLTISNDNQLGANSSGTLNTDVTMHVKTTLAGTGTFALNSARTINLPTPSTLPSSPNVAFNSTGTMTINGQVTGNNGIKKTGSGTVVLTNNNNDYGGGISSGDTVTAIDAGTLKITKARAIGSGNLSIASGATLVTSGNTNITVDRVPVITLGGANAELEIENFSKISSKITGTGPLVINQNSEGAYNPTNTSNDYTGGTTIHKGELSLNDEDALGTGDITLVGSPYLENFNGTGSLTITKAIGLQGGGTPILNNSGTMQLDGVISDSSGTNNLNCIGTGTFIFNASNTFGGTLKISSGGTVQVGADANLGGGSLEIVGLSGTNLNTLKITNSFSSAKTVTFSGSGFGAVNTNGKTLTLTGTVSGAAGVNKIGTGTLALNGTTNLTGDLDVDAGTVSFGSNASIGTMTGTGTIAFGANQLTFGSSSDGVFAGTITGTGNIIKQGSGSQTLPSGSTLSGNASINAGTLVANGTLGDTTVASGATLRGSGTVADLTNQGTVAPGNSIGTITVTGNYTQSSSADLSLEIGSLGESDLVDITGTASLDGSLTLSLIRGTHVIGDVYTLLSSDGGITGTWSSNNISSLPLGLELDVQTNNVFLTVTSNLLFLDKDIEGYNPKQVRDYLESNTGAEDTTMLYYIREMATLSSPDLTDALNRMHPAAYGFDGLVQESHSGVIDTNLTTQPTGSCSVSYSSAFDKRVYSVWTKAIGQIMNLETVQQMPRTSAVSYGGMVGIDQTLIKHGVAGIAGGYLYTGTTWKDDYAQGQTNTFFVGVYGDYLADSFSINTSLRFAYDYFNQARQVIFGTNQFAASNHHHGLELNGKIAADAMFETSGFMIKPFGLVNIFNLWESSFEEKGAGEFNLDVNSKTSCYLRAQLGIDFSKLYVLEQGKFCPSIYLSAMDIAQLSGRTYRAKMQNLDNSFTTRTYKENWIVFAPGMTLSFTNMTGNTFTASYGLQVNGKYMNQNIDVRISWDF